MKCGACGAPVKEGARFCANCGGRFKWPDAGAKSAKRETPLTEEGLNRQFELKECEAELAMWREELETREGWFGTCGVIGAVFCVVILVAMIGALPSSIHFGPYFVGELLGALIGPLVLLGLAFFTPYGMVWTWRKVKSNTQSGGWIIFGGWAIVIVYFVLFSILLIIGGIIGILAFFWMQKSIDTAQENVDRLEARIAELKTQAAAARTDQ